MVSAHEQHTRLYIAAEYAQHAMFKHTLLDVSDVLNYSSVITKALQSKFNQAACRNSCNLTRTHMCAHLQEAICHASSQLPLAILPRVRQDATFQPIGKAVLLPGISKLDNQRHLSTWQDSLGIVQIYGSLCLCPFAELYKCTACNTASSHSMRTCLGQFWCAIQQVDG